MPAVRAQIMVSGRVQGVAFRYSARREAARLGLTGWVRNLPDGRLELVVEGEESSVEEMIQWCGTGPPGALVRKADVKRGAATAEFSRFEITF